MTNAQISDFIVALFEELASRDDVDVDEVVREFIKGYQEG